MGGSIRLELVAALDRNTQTSASRLNRVCQGDFIYSRLYAWRGAFGVINSDLDGCFVSNEFPIFRIDETQLDIAYLNRWFQLPSVWRLVEDDCSGSTPTTRNRFKEQFFCALEVPLPKLAYQKVIVNRLDQLTDKVRQVNKHLDAIETDADTLIRNYIFSLSEKGITKRKMSELVSLRQTDIIVDQLENYQFAGVYSFGRGVFASVNKAGSEFAYPRLSRVNTGDFIYPKLMAWEGALGVVPQVCDSMVVSPEFPVFTINTDAILPEIIDIYFRTPSVWPELAGISGGTNARRRRLQPSAFLNYEMPVPPMLTQLKIREMHRRVQQLKTSHKAIREANQALIPATLERLFSNATGDRKTKCN
jgi:type I restriction enzyme S subunit